MNAKATPQSMTGFAAGTQDTDAGRLALELRSVNSRFLDLSFRMPDDLRALEPGLRERFIAGIRRGKVECRLSFARGAGTDASPPDAALLARLAQLQETVLARLPGAAPLSVDQALRWPGVLRETDAAQVLAAALPALAETVLHDFLDSRRREGARTCATVLEALSGIEAVVAGLRDQVPALVAHQQQRLAQRLAEALALAAGDAVPAEETQARIRQEITAHGLRADVAEELSRLEAHCAEVRRALAAGGAVGKRLDFLAQELNREANTLGSKAAAVEITRASVDLKLLIEQIREQAQNLE